jgi:hypothetical protein
MGQLFRNEGTEVTPKEFFNFLHTRNFVSITAKSVYNNIERFNSQELQQRFSILCPNETETPIVFFALDPISHELKKVRYVACRDEDNSTVIYRMTNDAQLDLNMTPSSGHLY